MEYHLWEAAPMAEVQGVVALARIDVGRRVGSDPGQSLDAGQVLREARFRREGPKGPVLDRRAGPETLLLQPPVRSPSL